MVPAGPAGGPVVVGLAKPEGLANSDAEGRAGRDLALALGVALPPSGAFARAARGDAARGCAGRSVSTATGATTPPSGAGTATRPTRSRSVCSSGSFSSTGADARTTGGDVCDAASASSSPLPSGLPSARLSTPGTAADVAFDGVPLTAHTTPTLATTSAALTATNRDRGLRRVVAILAADDAGAAPLAFSPSPE